MTEQLGAKSGDPFIEGNHRRTVDPVTRYFSPFPPSNLISTIVFISVSLFLLPNFLFLIWIEIQKGNLNLTRPPIRASLISDCRSEVLEANKGFVSIRKVRRLSRLFIYSFELFPFSIKKKKKRKTSNQRLTCRARDLPSVNKLTSTGTLLPANVAPQFVHCEEKEPPVWAARSFPARAEDCVTPSSLFCCAIRITNSDVQPYWTFNMDHRGNRQAFNYKSSPKGNTNW